MKELTSTVEALDASAGHTIPAGLVLGIKPEAITGNSGAVQEHMIHLMEDGTFLIALSTLEARTAISSLPPGSIIDLFDSPALSAARPAVVVKHGVAHTEFRTAHPKDGVSWKEYKVDGKRLSEADDARAALSSLFSLRTGSEGTQMLGEVFAIGDTANADEQLAEVGHSSHESPDKTLPTNIVLGNASIRTTVMSYIPVPGSEIRQFARVRMGASGIEPLATVDDGTYDTERVIERAFVNRAWEIASQNPTGYGSGTAPAVVLERMIDTMTVLPEVVGNEGTVGQARNKFAQSLQNAPKSF